MKTYSVEYDKERNEYTQHYKAGVFDVFKIDLERRDSVLIMGIYCPYIPSFKGELIYAS
jgi:hypothetical protein